MSTTSAAVLPATSVDTARLSILTATYTGAVTDEPGRGSAYTPSQIAAGQLVHAHPTRGNMFLVAFSRIWTGATANASTPGAFTAKTAVDRPYFGWVNTDSGGIVLATDRGGTPGVLYSTGIATPVLVGGASNGGMVYFLVTLGGIPALLSYRTDYGVVEFCGSSWVVNSVPIYNDIPNEEVVWNKGIHAHGAYLYFVGEQASSHTLFMCKKGLMRGGGTLYLGAKGWSPYPNDLSPLTDPSGTVLTSTGLVSLATFQDVWFMSVVKKPAADAMGTFLRARHPLSGWRTIAADAVNLGAVSPVATSGVFFQQGVNTNRAHNKLVSTDLAGIPYCHTSEAATSLRTAWDIMTVPRGVA